MPKKTSTIAALAVDAPLVQDAAYRFDAGDRDYIDQQVRGCQQHLVDSLVGGEICTWVLVDPGSAAIAVGDGVCLSGSSTGTKMVTRATFAGLSVAGAVFGIAMTAAPPGAMVRVAVGGGVDPTVTGLAASGGYSLARCNPTTARAERVATYAFGDYPIGVVDTGGYLALAPQYLVIASTTTATALATPSTLVLRDGSAGAAFGVVSATAVASSAANPATIGLLRSPVSNTIIGSRNSTNTGNVQSMFLSPAGALTFTAESSIQFLSQQSPAGTGQDSTFSAQQGFAGSVGGALLLGGGAGGMPGTNLSGPVQINLGTAVSAVSARSQWLVGGFSVLDAYQSAAAVVTIATAGTATTLALTPLAALTAAPVQSTTGAGAASTVYAQQGLAGSIGGVLTLGGGPGGTSGTNLPGAIRFDLGTAVAGVTARAQFLASGGNSVLDLYAPSAGAFAIQYTNAITAPQVSHATLAGTGATPGVNLTLAPQAGQAQTGVTANNNGGHLRVALAAAGTGGSGAAGKMGALFLDNGAGTMPTFGAIRIPYAAVTHNNGIIVTRTASDAADMTLLQVDGSNNVFYGSTTQCSTLFFDCITQHQFRISATAYATLSTAALGLNAPAITWTTGAAAPTISQADNTTNSATANTLTIQAPNATGTTSTGGGLDLKTGTGTTSVGAMRLMVGATVRQSINSAGIGFYTATPVAQAARAGQLTDSTGGTVTTTLAAGITDTVAKNAIASLAAKVNALDTIIHNLGLSA